MRRAGVLLGIVVLLGATGQPVAAGPDRPVSWVEPAAAPGSEAAAVAVARASGARVEVVEQRSETGQVYANPDGSFTAEESVVPVRVRRGSGWVPVDTTVEGRPDGTVAPKAVPVSLAFSGGGRAPLVRIAKDGKELALGWPTALPAPRLDGSSAVYADVLPGVDLRLTATAQGFSKVLVVKTREAAAHPDLATVRFGLSTRGLSVRADGTGGLAAYDTAGTPVLRSGAASMWDSASREGTADVAVGHDHLTLRPDRALLDDPATRYPVHIDPDFSAGLAGWTLVLEGVSQPKWNGANDEQIGKSGFSNWESPAVKYRTYFQFDTSRAAGKVIKGAEFNALEVWAPSCDPRWVRAYATNPVGPATNWANQPFPGGAVDIGAHNAAFGRPGCDARWLGWNATAVVGAPTTTIMLKADNEGDPFAWKKWAVGARLIVTYNSRPDRPIGITAEHKGCTVEPHEAFVNPLNPNDSPRGPTLRARVTDPDGGLVRAHFEWYTRGGARLGEVTTAGAATGSTFAVTVPSGVFGDGARAAYRVRGFDGADVGAWSGWCDVTIDRTRPSRPPVVRSATYPENDIGGSVGYTGGFTFSANGVGDVAGYLYDLHSSPSQFVPASQPGGSASALVTPPDDSPLDLYVRSVDRAGNVSDLYRYHFTPGRGTPPVAHWRLEGLHETTVVDSRPRRHDGAITIGPAKWVTGRHGDALRLDGTGGHVHTGGGPAVRTDRSFSVAAWVRLERLGDAWQVVASQDGNRTSSFYLQYASDVRKWSFNMMRSDVDNAVPDRVVSDAQVQLNVWTHLVGVFDHATGKLRLYVNGVPQTEVGTRTTLWTHGTGTVQLGRVKYNGGHQGYFQGAVDEVRIYDRVLSAEEVYRLVSTPVVEELFLPLDEGTGTTAADISGNYRSAQLAAGAGWTAGTVGTGAVSLNGAGGSVSVGRPAVRTDRSFMVSASVRLGARGTAQTAVSQDGPRSSGFLLGYRPGTHGWTFSVSEADADNPAPITVDSAELGFVALPDEWTHLTGVYDATVGEIRLYVNGDLAGRASGRTTANVEGALVLGRHKLAGQPAGYWGGAVDDVHLWTGVHDAVALATFLQPVTSRPSAYDGQLGRFVTHGGQHITSAGAVPDGYHFEGKLGMYAPAGAENTRMLYMCRLGSADEFTSPAADCEGQEVLRPLGRVYVSPPEDVPVLPVYRCLVPGFGHFDSHDPACEGRTTEFLLGYTRAYGHLIRYNSPSFPFDHRSSTGRVPADYLPEGRLGAVAATGEPGTVTLWGCLNGTDSFVSTDAACEGATVTGRLGFVWPDAPEGHTSHQLYRCRASWGDIFESTSPACEGQTVVRPLGYLITRL